MVDNNKQHQKVAIIDNLEAILYELDKQQLFLPALKIVEALESLGATAAPDVPTDG